MSSSPLEVFLSHASSDRQHVELVRGQIEALGIRVYLAEHDPQPGRSLAGKVDAALERSALVVVLITSTSIDSRYVQQEIGAAIARRKPIVPIVDSRIVGQIDLGMLTGVEYLIIDLERPADALQKITASLQSFIVVQPPAVSQAAAPAAVPELSDGEKLLLLGAVALMAILLFGESGEKGGAAQA